MFIRQSLIALVTMFYILTNFIVSLCILHQIKKKRKHVRLPPDLFLVLHSPQHTGAHTEDCELYPYSAPSHMACILPHG